MSTWVMLTLLSRGRTKLETANYHEPEDQGSIMLLLSTDTT